jgi:putative membrane protein
VWAISTGEPFGYSLKLFFLGCVIVAGLYGAATASRAILFIQAIPAAAALAVTLATR